MSGLGGGRRWREEQREVLDHAKGLYYDKAPGGSLIEETDDKAKWVAWRDKFGDFKSKNVPLEESGQAWWQTYPASVAPESSGGESSGGGGLLSPPSGSPPMGPYPEANVYFPMLVPEYAPPSAQDWTSYMPRVGPYDAPTPYLGGGAPANFPQATLYPGIGQDVEPGIPDYNIGGLLYQPWTTEYQQAFVPPNIWNYEPNQFGVGPVQHMGAPFGPINVVPPEELFTEEEDDEYDWATDPEGRKSGGHVGTPGSQASGYGVAQGTQTGTNSSGHPSNQSESDIRLKKNIKFLGKSNTLDINKLRSNSI